MKDKYLRKLRPFQLWALQNFPFIEADFDVLTNYEMMCKIVEYLNKVIDNSNSQNAKINELGQLVNELENYLENLDVQEEINNKLDEMAESGQLTDIIAQYLDLAGVLAYDTVSNMVSAENLVNGSICKTLGKNTYNDGIGAFYKIRQITSDDVIDNDTIVALNISNTLIAEKIKEFNSNDTSDILYYGADPTGTIDSTNAINTCINNNKGKTINFTIGNYLVSNTINLPFKNNEKVSINGNGSTLIVNGEITNLIHAGYDRTNNEVNDVGFSSYIKDLNINCENATVTNAIYNEDAFKDLKLFNIRIYRSLNGIKFGSSNTFPCDILVKNCMIYGKGSEYNGTGIIANSTDYNIVMCRIYGFRKGFEINGGGNIDSCHVLLRWENQTSQNFDPYVRNSQEFNQYYEPTMFALVNSNIRIINSYCDSMYKFIHTNTSEPVDINHCFYYNSRDNVNCELFTFSRGDIQFNLIDSVFHPSANNKGEIIVIPTDGFNNYANINLKNNMVRRLSKITNQCDPILSNIPVGHDNINMTANTWYIIGGISNVRSYDNYSLSVFINAYKYIFKISTDDNGNITSIIQVNKGSGLNNWIIGGIKYNSNSLFLCIKNNNNLQNVKFSFDIDYSYNPAFRTIPVNGVSWSNTSRLLSDYTNLTPSYSYNVNNVIV